MLPLPKALLATVYTEGQVWFEAEGDERYRRGVYTYIKRILPYPGLTTFDAATRDFACVRRPRSNNALQALTLLNDPLFVEAAHALADRLLADFPGDPGARLTQAFLRCTAREPDAQERVWLTGFLDEQQAAHGEAHAWRLLCRVLLNLDETITRT
jgi:hypothetical protein